MSDHQEDFYQRMREAIRRWLSEKGASYKWADYLLAAPDLFHLLCRLSVDKDVAAVEKAKLIAAIAYYVSPLDLLPEAVFGPVAYIDDVVVACVVLKGLITNTDPAIVMKHWAGDKDVLELVKQILEVTDELIGSGLLKRIIEAFRGAHGHN